MRTPLNIPAVVRNTVGFERLLGTLEALSSEKEVGYPVFDLEKTGENAYRIVLAVAGFSDNEITIETNEGILSIKGEHAPPVEGEPKKTYLHQGIARRNFIKKFQLEQYVEVTSAELKDGLLAIDLVRNVPEAKRPRTIDISVGA